MNNAKLFLRWVALVSLIVVLCSCETLQEPKVSPEVSQQVNNDPEVIAGQARIDIKTSNLKFWELEIRKSESIDRELAGRLSRQNLAGGNKSGQDDLRKRFHEQRIEMIERFLELEKGHISNLKEKQKALDGFDG